MSSVIPRGSGSYPVNPSNVFHAENRTKVVSVALTVLDEVVLVLVLVLRGGLAPQSRADCGAVEPLWRAVQDLVRTLDGLAIAGAAEPVHPPSVEDLARAGLPVGDPGGYAAAVRACAEHRRRLHGWCVSDGWDGADLRLTHGDD
jgi:hypothetical protein